MSNINLGISESGKKVSIDIQTLVSTRLLVTASSGGGKSETLRRILEEAVGHIQCIVIDPEGEFSTLREQKPYVLVGEGGETPADIRTAALVATRLLELNASAVCDIYEMPVLQRHEWVKRFLDSLVHAPKSLWHPVLVVLDEAHTYCMDSETEILTISGWRKWSQAQIGELVVAYNPETQRCGYEKIQRLIFREYSGEMVSLKSDGIDALVTPEHRVVLQRIQRGKGRYKVYDPQFVEASRVPRHIYIPATGETHGVGLENLDPLLCRILGWVITDGYWCGGHGRKTQRYIGIEQSLSTRKNGVFIADEMRAVLNGFYGLREPKERAARGKTKPSLAFYLGRDFSARILSWLRDLHRIPREILAHGSPQQLKALYDGLVEGDGTCRNGKWVAFYPGHNEGLADDFQELCTRLGISASKKFVKQTSQWSVLISKRTRHYIRKTGKEQYCGLTWDITVPSGAFIARRRGKVFVTGNCPEHGYNESVASQAVIDLCNLGRKRGFCAILATQRISKLSKNAVEPLQNYLVGRTTYDDQKRAASIFKIDPGAATREFSIELERLKDGQFIARGRAITGDLLKVQVTRGLTRPPKTGTAMAGVVTPTPDAIKSLLPKLADLPQAAEKKAKTEDDLRREVSEARKQVAELTRQLAKQQQESNSEEVQMLQETLTQLKTEADEMEKQLTAYQKRITKAAEIAKSLSDVLSEPEIEKVVRTYVAPLPRRAPSPPVARPVKEIVARAKSESNGNLRAGARRMLAVLAQWYPSGRTESQVAAQVQMKKTGGTWSAYKSDLRNGGYFEVRGDGLWYATDEGRAYVGADAPEMPSTTDEVVQLWGEKLRKGAREMLDVLVNHKGYPLAKDDLGRAVNMESSGGTFSAYLSDLKQAGLIIVDRDGVRANAETLFL